MRVAVALTKAITAHSLCCELTQSLLSREVLVLPTCTEEEMKDRRQLVSGEARVPNQVMETLTNSLPLP